MQESQYSALISSMERAKKPPLEFWATSHQLVLIILEIQRIYSGAIQASVTELKSLFKFMKCGEKKKKLPLYLMQDLWCFRDCLQPQAH